MTEIYASFVADHTFDHLRLWTTRIQCREEHTKAVNPDAKAPKIPPNHAKNQKFSVWDFDAVGSNPATPTKNQPKMRFFTPLSADFLLIIGFYPPLLENPLTAEMRLVPWLQHKPLSFFGRLFL